MTSDIADTDERGNGTQVAGETADDTTQENLDRWVVYHYNRLRKWSVILHGAGALAFATLLLMQLLGRPPGDPHAIALMIFVVAFLGAMTFQFVVKSCARRDAGSGEYPLMLEESS